MRWFWKLIGRNRLVLWLWAKAWAHRLKPGSKVIIVRGWRTALIDEPVARRICVSWMFSWEKW